MAPGFRVAGEGCGGRLPLTQSRRVGEREIGFGDCAPTEISDDAAARARWEAVLTLLDLERLRASPLQRDPFDYVIVEKFVPTEHTPDLIADFPPLGGHGSFPLAKETCGTAFARLAAELEGEDLRRSIEDKFAIDLDGRPTMITLRGFSDGKDGRIHTDSATKLITVLLYLNPVWEDAAGRLRLLRGADDLDDCVAEIAPLAGTMVAFRRSEHSFHGHYPHVGERRVIQLNWVTDHRVVRREIGRHRWSARVKALNPFG
jgi:SM-20-related protein